MRELLFDIGTAYAYDTKFESVYHTLSFNPKRVFYLTYFDLLTIKPYQDTLKFSGKLLKLNFDKETKELFKTQISKELLPEAQLQKIGEEILHHEEFEIEEIKNNISTEMIDDKLDVDNNLNIFKQYVKSLLKTDNIKVIKYGNDKMVQAELEKITLNHEELLCLFNLCNCYNAHFKILAKYNYDDENDDKCYGIKFLWIL